MLKALVEVEAGMPNCEETAQCLVPRRRGRAYGPEAVQVSKRERVRCLGGWWSSTRGNTRRIARNAEGERLQGGCRIAG